MDLGIPSLHRGLPSERKAWPECYAPGVNLFEKYGKKDKKAAFPSNPKKLLKLHDPQLDFKNEKKWCPMRACWKHSQSKLPNILIPGNLHSGQGEDSRSGLPDVFRAWEALLHLFLQRTHLASSHLCPQGLGKGWVLQRLGKSQICVLNEI